MRHNILLFVCLVAILPLRLYSAENPVKVTGIGCVNVMDYISDINKYDVSDDIQRCIDSNPNRVIYFPDGTYNISKPIRTSAWAIHSVCLELSNYAVIHANEGWNSSEFMIILGGKEHANDNYNIGSNYYLKGGVIDCNYIANGIAIESGRETVVSDLSIKFANIGMYIPWGANNGSSDCDIHDINIVGNCKTSETYGIRVDGFDNTFTNIRMSNVQKGMVINSAGNFITNVHPLYCFNWGWEWDYVNSVAFEDNAANNWYTGCYSDQFATGFKNKGVHNIYHNCYAFWYSDNVHRHVAFQTDGPFNSVVTNFTMGIAGWNKSDQDNCVLVESGWGNGKGVFDNLYIDDESVLTNTQHLRYIKGEPKPNEPLYAVGPGAGFDWANYDALPPIEANNGIFTYSNIFPGIFKLTTGKGKYAEDWEALHKSAIIPTSGDRNHILVPGETIQTKVWNFADDPGNYVSLYPGYYSLALNKSDLTLNVGWMPLADNNNEWFFAGNQDGWQYHYMDMRYDAQQGKYTMTTTLDKLESWQDFKFFNDEWQQFSYPDTEIHGFGTYTFNYYPGNEIRCARTDTTLNNVELTCEWYKNDVSHMYVTISEKKQNAEAGIEKISDINSSQEVQYYNLNGTPVNADSLIPGIYIRKQGNNISKTIVK